MYLFKSKNGRIYAKSSPSMSTPYNDRLSLDENKTAFYSSEAAALKGFKFEQTPWAQELCEFTGTIKELYELITLESIPNKDDGCIYVSKEIIELILAHQNEVLKEYSDIVKCGRLAYLYGQIDDKANKRKCLDKQFELYQEMQAEKELKARLQASSEIYKKYIKGKACYLAIQESIIALSLKNNLTTEQAKARLIQACNDEGDEAAAKFLQKVKASENQKEYIKHWALNH